MCSFPVTLLLILILCLHISLPPFLFVCLKWLFDGSTCLEFQISPISAWLFGKFLFFSVLVVTHENDWDFWRMAVDSSSWMRGQFIPGNVSHLRNEGFPRSKGRVGWIIKLCKNYFWLNFKPSKFLCDNMMPGQHLESGENLSPHRAINHMLLSPVSCLWRAIMPQISLHLPSSSSTSRETSQKKLKPNRSREILSNFFNSFDFPHHTIRHFLL